VLKWRSHFELDLGDVKSIEVLQRARASPRERLQGLRLRVIGKQIRARYVVGQASAASLLIVGPEQRGSRTYLVVMSSQVVQPGDGCNLADG
jgi:hypothetical protein